jgi:hypothetical protein
MDRSPPFAQFTKDLGANVFQPTRWSAGLAPLVGAALFGDLGSAVHLVVFGFPISANSGRAGEATANMVKRS